MISADKHFIDYSDEPRIQNWESQTESIFLSFAQSEPLNLESIIIRVMKGVFVSTNHTVIIAKRVHDIFSLEYLYSLGALRGSKSGLCIECSKLNVYKWELVT